MIVEIYVNLLEEGTVCSRPTQAEVLEHGLFRLLPTQNYYSNDENWELTPGSIARGQEVRRDGKSTLLAVAPKLDSPRKGLINGAIANWRFRTPASGMPSWGDLGF